MIKPKACFLREVGQITSARPNSVASQLIRLLIGAMLVTLTTEVHAQSPSHPRATPADLDRVRETENSEDEKLAATPPVRSAAPQASSAAPKDFVLSLSFPAQYSTNVVNASSEVGGTNLPDWHSMPELRLRWAHQYDWVKLAAWGDVSLDRYRNLKSAEINIVSGTAKASMTDGKSDLFVPYLMYSATTFLSPGFVSLDDRRQDYAGGFSSGAGLREGSIIRYSLATRPGDFSFGVDIRVGQHTANLSDIQHKYLNVGFDVSYIVSRELTVTLVPKARWKNYTNYYGSARSDVRLGGDISAVWTPLWLTRVLPYADITFSAEYLNNRSTEPTANYKLWEFGPTVTLKTRF
jgi:hypothetical protein